MKRRGHIAATLLVAFLSGCTGLGAAPRPCFDDTECLGGQQCILGECAWIPRLELEMDVTPAAPSGYLYQPFSHIDTGAPEGLTLVVPRPLSVTVTVPETGPAARVSFESMAELRRPLRASAEVAPRQETVLSLVRGTVDASTGRIDPIPYALVAVPIESGCCGGDAPCTAPVIERNVQPSADFPLQPAFPEKVTRIVGHVIVSEADWTPVTGMQVQAVDPVTGNFSLPTVTDEKGAFCLAVPTPEFGTAAFTVRIGPSENRPTVEIEDVRVSAEATEVDVGNLTMGAHGTPILFAANSVLTEDGTPVPGAQVLFTGAVDPKGTFRAAATTDERGHFDVALLRGDYQVQVLPPANTPHGALVTELSVDGSRRASLKLVVPLRPQLSGRVLDRDGLPIESAEVVAEPQSSERLAPEPAAPSRVATATDAEGRYQLYLDPGAYRLSIRPPPMSGLGWSVGRAVAVANADQAVDDIVLEPALSVEGKVLGDQAMEGTIPLAGARIEVYARTPSNASVLVWETRAETDGHFELALPADLGTGR